MSLLRTAGCVLSTEDQDEPASDSTDAYDEEPPLLQKHGVLTLSGRHVFCPDEALSSVLSFELDQTFGAGSSTLDLFASTLAPVAEGVTRGEAGTAVFFGRSKDDAMVQELVCGIATLASQNILDLVAGDALHAATTDVRVAWFEMRGNAITDLLREVTDPDGAHVPLTVAPQGSSSDTSAPTVEGLLEVQITTAADVLQLMQNVQEAHGDFAPSAHSVFQITVHERALAQYDAARGASASASSSLPPPPPPRATSMNIVTIGCAGGDGGDPPLWRRALSDVMDALSLSRPTVPFRRSALTAFLRDALALRCNAAFVSVLYTRLEDITETLAGLKFTAAIRAVHATRCGEAPPAAATAATATATATATGGARPRATFLSPVFEGGFETRGGRSGASPRGGGVGGEEEEFGLQAALLLSHRSPRAAATTAAAALATPPQQVRLSVKSQPSPAPHVAAGRGGVDKAAMAELAHEMGNQFGLGMGLGAKSMEDAIFAGGAAAMEWYSALLATLTATRDDNAALRDTVDQLQRACEVLEDSARLGGGGGGRSSPQQQQRGRGRGRRGKAPASLKHRLVRAQSELKDFEVYRDVMEAQMVSFKSDMQRVAGERDAALKQAKKLRITSSRQRRAQQARTDGSKVRRTSSQRSQGVRQFPRTHAALFLA